MITEKDQRLNLVRQYLMDVEGNPNGLLEANDAVNYVRYNFHEAVKASMVEMDMRRKISRTMSSHKIMLDAKIDLVEIASPMIQLTVGKMANIVQTEAKFSFWFHKTLLSPIIAEEDRILRYSAHPIILGAGTIRSYVDRVAELFRFKLWESASFPEAKDVPPRVELSPDEVTPPTRRLE